MTSPTSLKPFDLEAARNGAPIMYANGEPVAEFHVWKDGSISSRPMRGPGYLHGPDGTCYGNSPRHLVMAPPPMREVTMFLVKAQHDRPGFYGWVYTSMAAVTCEQCGIDPALVQPITLKVPV